MKYPLGPVFVFVVIAACGPKPVPTEATAVGSLDQPFDAMDHETRIAFMKERVVPVMAPIFQRHNAERFARFDCTTCHGEAAKTGDFVMPNDKLPKIGNDVMKKYDRADVEWMLNEVKPTMARLLKQQEWSPVDPSGFDCFACHPRE
jgi:hypothetical protein